MNTKLCRGTPNNLVQVARFIKEQTKDDPVCKDFKVEDILLFLKLCQFVYFIKDLDTQVILSVLYAIDGTVKILFTVFQDAHKLIKKFSRDAEKEGLTKWVTRCRIGDESVKALWLSQGATIQQQQTVLELNLEKK